MTELVGTARLHSQEMRAQADRRGSGMNLVVAVKLNVTVSLLAARGSRVAHKLPHFPGEELGRAQQPQARKIGAPPLTDRLPDKSLADLHLVLSTRQFSVLSPDRS